MRVDEAISNAQHLGEGLEEGVAVALGARGGDVGVVGGGDEGGEGGAGGA